jgi:hypothetical protein
MISSTIADAQRTTLDTLVEVQAKVVEANRALADTVKSAVGDLPTPKLADTVFDTSLLNQTVEFWSQVVDANRNFARQLIEAWLPEQRQWTASSEPSSD